MNNRSTLEKTIQDAVTDALARPGASQNQIAKQIGVSPATIISLKRGEFEKISDGMLNRLRAFFRIDNWDIRATRNFKTITAMCDDARDNKRFLAVAGFTGAGKTTALRTYAAKNSEVYYVLATVMHTKKGFLEAIQRAMGINDGGTSQQMMREIVNRLNSDTDPLLIIDDGGKLIDPCFRLLQIIYDETEFSTGIVLAGTEYLKEYIDKRASRNSLGFRELKRRIAFWQPMYRPSTKTIAGFCKAYDIHDQGAISYINKHINNYGDLRNLVTNAIEVAQREEVAVTRELLSDLAIGDSAYENLV